VRIVVFAGLRNVDITSRYLMQVQEKVLEPMGFELRTYPAIRRWAYGMSVPDDLSRHIRSAVARFLRGAPAAMREAMVRSAV